MPSNDYVNTARNNTGKRLFSVRSAPSLYQPHFCNSRVSLQAVCQEFVLRACNEFIMRAVFVTVLRSETDSPGEENLRQ
jgi:hypothetical protein